MIKKIQHYGIIGDLYTAALIGKDGSMDWLCLPYLDSSSVFGFLLDADAGGRFLVQPVGRFDSTQSYLPQTNILVTDFRTREGVLRLTDFMPVIHNTDTAKRHEVFRIVEMVQGWATVRIVFEPRFDYARDAAHFHMDGHWISAQGKNDRLGLAFSRAGMRIEEDRAAAEWELNAGERIGLHLIFNPTRAGQFDFQLVDQALDQTGSFWRIWLARSETGLDLDVGPFKDMIDRSALVLKLLEFQPSGAIAAAATTSLPEQIGGVRNWDYRFSWVRDSAMTIEALYKLGHLAEMQRYFQWLKKVISQSGGDIQIMYGLRGETHIPEQELPHLKGYKNSRPVRIGNEAYQQKQLDIYGEIMDAALRLSNYVGKIDQTIWPFLSRICDLVVERWHEKDSGIWEVRGGPYHFVYSKIMCWVALDRGVRIARRYGFPGRLEAWGAAKERIKTEVLQKGWNDRKKAFIQHYGTDALDASNLLIPFYGFLPYNDPRVESTVQAIRKELYRDGLVYRYLSADGLPGLEGAFIICTFWLIDNLIGLGKLEEAQVLLLRLEQKANHLGLFSEEYCPVWHEALGNFPQALTHIGYINSVVSLCKARAKSQYSPQPRPLIQRLSQQFFFRRKFLLNDGAPDRQGSTLQIAADLKHLMNVLRGAFFRTAEGRIAYDEMAGSPSYRRYVECSYSLKQFDLETFETREEKTAFWLNLFNTMTIHGVIALGIRNSVKEVTHFFRRIQYQVGCYRFSADDIEHGILRANHRFPYSPLRPFGENDPRGKYSIGKPDPRIHFALVCASASCPPIEIYSAERLDEDLKISGKTFLNAGGVRIDRQNRTLYLSRVFKWYAQDFGQSAPERLMFIAPYLYEHEDRRFIEKNAAVLKIKYLPYDWRLNRL